MLVTYSPFSSHTPSFSSSGTLRHVKREIQKLTAFLCSLCVPVPFYSQGDRAFLCVLLCFDLGSAILVASMEMHRCRLCWKTFANGRALGGHMRSHMSSLREEEDERPSQLSEETGSAASFLSSSSSDGDEEEGGENGQSYVLRENPKRSVKMVDPEFSFAVHSGSVVILQDRESETESSKNPTRKRSKRARKSDAMEDRRSRELKPSLAGDKTELWTEPEPLSSISDTTTEEDLAVCLMMLSRDSKWKRKEQRYEPEGQYRNHELCDEARTGQPSCNNQARGRYKCETCHKVFKSYQALGGHRASHKKNRVSEFKTEHENAATSGVSEKKIFECPVCFKVFSSGQALGGHKRSHGIGLADVSRAKSLAKENFIDLNLPAPLEEDDLTSQIEHSAVSDAEYANGLVSSDR